MSSEPIDIEVRDKVAAGIREKLLNLAQAALEGANNVDRLNAQLAKVDGSQLNKLSNAQRTLEQQTLRNNLAYLQQETALNKAVAAEAKAASSAEKLAAAQARSQASQAVAQAQAAEATQRLAAAAAKAETAQIRAAAASARVAQASQAATAAVNAFGETEAQVAARLAAVAQAGANLSKQQASIGTTANQAAIAEKNLAAQTKLSGDAAQTAAARYSNYMSAINTLNKSSGSGNTAALNSATQAANAAAEANKKLAESHGNVSQASEISTRSLLKSYIQYQLLATVVRAAADAVKGYFEAAADYQNLQNKLQQVAVSQREVNELTLDLLAVANRARAPLESVGTTFQRINNAIKAVGGSQKEAIQITEALSKATAAAGLSASEQASALLQVSQAFNKGKLDGDEFRSVMENFPQFADAIAKSLGLANKGLLFEAAKQGKITLDVMRDAMIKLNEAADQQLGRSTLTLDQAFTKLKNSTTVMIGELDRALGITATLAKGFNLLAEAIERAAKQNAPTGTATLAGVEQDKLNIINQQVEAQKALIDAGKAGVAGQNRLNNLLKIQASLQTNIKENAQDSVKTLRELDNAASLNAEAGKQGAFATALTAVNKEMDTLKVGTHKADTELAAYRKNLENLGKAAKDLGTPEALKAYTDAKKLQAQAEAAIIRKDTIRAPKVTATPEDTREKIIARVTADLQDQLAVYGDIREQREALLKIERLDSQLATNTKNGKLAPLRALNDAEKESLLLDLQKIETNKRVEASQDAIYQNIQGPQQRLQDGQVAINNLLDKNRISADKAAEAQRALNFAYDSATNPLFQFDRELAQQNKLLESNLTAKERAAKSTVDQINNQLAPQGKKLTDDQAKHIEAAVTAQQHLNEVTAAFDTIVAANQGARDNLTTQQEALNKAQAAGIITTEQYATATTQLAIAKAQLRLDNGVGSSVDLGLASIGRLLDGYKNVLSGLSDSFGEFFKSIDQGFADSVAHAIVFGDSLSDALLNVARQAVEQLLSSLIKLGIQWVIQQALGTEATGTRVAGIAAETAAFAAGKASQTAISIAALETVTAANVASGIIVAEAWAAAATLVSLASYGANAIPAAEGIATTYALTQALAAFKEGGYTGNGGVNDPAGIVHGKEFVVNAAGTAANRGTLEAMNRGESVGGGGGTVKVSISNYGTSKDFEVEQVSRDEVRIIARDEAKAAVNRDSANVVAGAMTNPNSKVSKAINNNWNVQPAKT